LVFLSFALNFTISNILGIIFKHLKSKTMTSKYKLPATLVIFLLTILDSSAQTAARQDTILLSVHNNGQRFRMTPAMFGQRTTSSDLLKEMVVVYDTTVNKTRRVTADTSGRRPMMYVTSHVCGKLDRKVKGKVVLMDWDTLCDPSLIARNVQRDSGVALVLVHPRNHRDSIKIGFTSFGFANWAYTDSIRIPVYSVRRDMGAKIGKMVPSLVGIKRPDTMPDDAQGYVRRNGLRDTLSGAAGSLNRNNGIASSSSNKLEGASLSIAPNPADEVAVLNYSFSEATDINIEVRNASGMLVYSTSLKGVQTGSYTVDTDRLASGVYTVDTSIYGVSAKDVQRIGRKMVVVH
jgi:Secretion system C-terminal sorting domain